MGLGGTSAGGTAAVGTSAAGAVGDGTAAAGRPDGLGAGVGVATTGVQRGGSGIGRTYSDPSDPPTTIPRSPGPAATVTPLGGVPSGWTADPSWRSCTTCRVEVASRASRTSWSASSHATSCTTG